MTAGPARNLPQGFASLFVTGSGLDTEAPQLVIARTGMQGGAEYLRAYNAINDGLFDKNEALKYRWGADEGRIVAHGARIEGEELVLDLGRNVNALLDQQTNYRFQLVIDGQTVERQCAIAWTRVPPVRPVDLATFVESAKSKAVEKPQEPIVLPMEATPVVTGSPSVEAMPRATVVVGQASLKQRSKWVGFGAGVLVLLVVATAAYFLWLRPREETRPQAASEKPVESPPQPPVAQSPTAPAPQSPITAETREQRLARIIVQSPEVAIGEGKRAAEAQEFDEAEFLFRNACTRRNADACRLAAQLYDPQDLTSDRRTQRKSPDARLAVSLYKMSIDAGGQDATKDLARLREIIERAAQDGDSAAKVLLDTWPK